MLNVTFPRSAEFGAIKVEPTFQFMDYVTKDYHEVPGILSERIKDLAPEEDYTLKISGPVNGTGEKAKSINSCTIHLVKNKNTQAVWTQFTFKNSRELSN